MLATNASAQENNLQQYIDAEVAKAAEQLNEKNLALSTQITSLWNELKEKGEIEKTGTDEQLRASFVSMQGLIESGMTTALKQNAITGATAYIVTPKTPTPLTIEASEGKTFAQIDSSDPKDFARLRTLIQINFMAAGGVIHSYNTETSLHGTYGSYLSKYSNNLENHTVLASCPPDKTGALYYAGDLPITVQSKQISQIDATKGQETLWAIRIGDKAKDREQEIRTFIGL